MAKRKRKYVAHKRQQRLHADILSTTFYYHCSAMTDKGARCGNHKHHLTNEQARLLLTRPNTWSGMVIAFFNDNGTGYVRTQTFERTKPITRYELNDVLDSVQLQLVKAGNTEQATASAYFIVPDCTVDVEADKDAILELFEAENPYDYTVTVLASMLRA